MMFNNLYRKYKNEVLKTSAPMAIKDLKAYEKIFLGIIVLGAILSGLFSLLKMPIWSLISVGIIISDFVFFHIFRSKKSEQKRIIDEIITPAANERMENVLGLLKDFNIDIKDEKQLDDLIKQAQKEQLKYDAWKGFRKMFKGMASYIILPIITLFLAEYFKDVGLETLIIRAVTLILICSCVVLCITSISQSFNDLINPDIRDLNAFIDDIEDIKVFPQKANDIAENSENKKDDEHIPKRNN